MTNRHVEEGTFETRDGTELFFRAWHPLRESEEPKALILLHRGHEHTGRLHDTVDRLELPDFWAFGYDARGHGRSPGRRGYAPDFSVLVSDLDAFVEFVCEKYGFAIENVAVVANSVAGVLTSAWVHDYAPKIRGMVLAAPGFRIRLYVPLAIPCLRLLDRVRHPMFISSYVKGKLLTHDEEQERAYDNDELITRDIAVNILISLRDTADRIVADAGAIHTPTCVLSAGSDWVVANRPQAIFFERLGSIKKEMHIFPGFFHGVLFERGRDRAFRLARRFLLECFAAGPSPPDLTRADLEGYTREEFDRLKTPAPFVRRIVFAATSLAMRTLGRLSAGIRIGYESGFDSGLSLDHVYGDKAQGLTPIGRAIDRVYLDSPGWRGIRQRKRDLQESLDELIGRLEARGTAVRIMDVASGPGRYVLETAKKHETTGLRALLRDFESKNIDKARRIADEIGCENVELETADAFDPQSYVELGFRPNIAIVSGLYELFPDNDSVSRSLRGIASVIDPGGYLVYTGQPWHPQIELIARVLPNRNGEPWIMRRRTQLEMDQLVEAQGFRKLRTRIDRWGIFTVSIAEAIRTGQ